MKKVTKVVLVAILTIFFGATSQAQNLGDLLKGGLGGTLENVLEGVFSSSKIEISDLAGTWQASGPAVCFQGEGFLKKAGGVAAAAAVENKLQPYYNQYGLNNATLVVDESGNFTLNTGKLKLSGVITRKANAQDGVFEFNFKLFNGGISLGKVTTYVQKTSRTMDVMFDASKLKSLLSTISKYSGISIVKTLSGILDSYDGMCVGFKMDLTKGATTTTTSKTQKAEEAAETGIGILRGILTGGKK